MDPSVTTTKTKEDFRSRDPNILILMIVEEAHCFAVRRKRPVISVAVWPRAERTATKDPGKQA